MTEKGHPRGIGKQEIKIRQLFSWEPHGVTTPGSDGHCVWSFKVNRIVDDLRFTEIRTGMPAEECVGRFVSGHGKSMIGHFRSNVLDEC